MTQTEVLIALWGIAGWGLAIHYLQVSDRYKKIIVAWHDILYGGKK